MAIKVTRHGLLLKGQLLPLWSGALHYFRLERSKWGLILDQVKTLGFEVVETYIPWSVHELEAGKFDFGQKQPNRDLDHFLKLVHERGLKIQVRPGPHINAELTYFGYPRRVLEIPECRSVSVDGDPVWMPVPPKMWPAPSYASEAFLAEVALWFDAVCAVLQPRLYPKGPVIAVQADNEFSNFFRTSPYDHDYHPDAIKLYHRFLAEKYQSTSRLSAAYGKSFTSFDDVPPARECTAKTKADLPYYLDWVEFREYSMQNALRRLRDLLKDRGITGIPITHNYPSGYDLPPNNYTKIEEILDLQGPDIYPLRQSYPALKSLAQFAAGLSRYPTVPEFSSGAWLWNPPVTLDDQKFTTPALLMHGIKGINFYMIVERERWYGSPIARDGRPRPGYTDLYKKFNAAVKKLRLAELDKAAPALLLGNRDYERLQHATTLMDPVPLLMPDLLNPEEHCREDTFGFEDCIQLDAWLMDRAFFWGLDAAKITFNSGNTEQPLEALQQYQLVLLPTFGFLARATQEKLLAYAQAGGTLVIGPRMPELDEQMQPCTLLQDGLGPGVAVKDGIPTQEHLVGQGRGIWIQSLLPRARRGLRPPETTALLRRIAELARIGWDYTADDPDLDTVLHEDSKTRVLFVANPTEVAKLGLIKLKGAEKLTDAESGEQWQGQGEVEIPMPAYTVRILEVTH